MEMSKVLDKFRSGKKKITNSIKGMLDGDVDTVKAVALEKKKKRKLLKLNSDGLLKGVLKYRKQQDEAAELN